MLIVSNRNLQPEESSSYNFGVVYSPKYVPGLTFSVDAWGIDRDKVIGSSPADEVLARELTGTLLPGESVERDAGGGITRIVTQNRNLGSQSANGVDFTLLYQLDTALGTFTSITRSAPERYLSTATPESSASMRRACVAVLAMTLSTGPTSHCIRST